MEKVLEKINQASLKFLIPLPSEEMYKVIVDEALRLLESEYGSIFLAERGSLERVYATADFLNEVRIRNHGNTYKTFKSSKPMVIDAEGISNFHKTFIDNGIRSIIHVPLSYRNESIGVLALHSKRNKHFSGKELHILKLYGSLASLAIKKTQLYEETQKAVEVRDLFISLASHELRTPLTSINGYIQLLHGKLGKQDTNEGKWVRELYEESQRMTSLVKELLEVNRIKQGQFQFSFVEVNFFEIVAKTIKRLSVLNKEYELVFKNKTSAGELFIIGDPEKLLQMITAFLENAIKFSPVQFTIEVILRETKKHVILSIEDKGVGIKKEDLELIMEGFYKGSQQDKEGMGVGLVLARHIIQAHHGELVIKSDIKKGTKVEVRLPKVRQ